MQSRILIFLGLLAILALPAQGNTVVEVVGRVNGTNLNSGPWAGVRPGEYFYMTFEVLDTGSTPPGSTCGTGLRQYTLTAGSLHATVHGVYMDAPLVGGTGQYLNPTFDFVNNCPVADVAAFDSGATWAVPGTGTARYSMIFELHDSTGHAWTTSEISQSPGFYGSTTFDYVEWNVTYPNNQTSFSLQFVSLNIHPAGQATGSCCMGDGWCAVTSSQSCVSSAWAEDGTCSTNPCAPAGACCLPGGGCQLMTQAACAGVPDAVYEGDFSTCQNTTCPPTSACCLSGACQVLTQQACLNRGGTWQPNTIGWLGVSPGCDIQPQFYAASRMNLPDATGTTTITPGVFTSSIDVTDEATVQSVEVWLGIGMPRINDMRIRLTGPNGTTLELVTRIGSTPPDCVVTPIGPGYTMYDTLILQDSASQTFYQHVTSAPAGSQVSGGRYQAAGCGGTPVSLDAASPAGFGGIAMSGIWSIEFRDERPGIQTYLNAWGLSFNGGNPPTCAVTCGSADFNCDGDTATDADIEAFFACLAGVCPPPPCNSTADFNGDGDSGTDADIEAFFRVLAGGTC
jgi:subtilisin-like proprotein convertase family protein